MTGVLTCTKCKTPLESRAFNTPGMLPCPGCQSLLHVHVFPAFFKGIEAGRQAERVLSETESSCFYHPAKKAVVPCDACGRFLCALCECELNGQHLCPSCLETGRKKGRIKNLENHRTLYDTQALGLALIPIIFWPFTLLTAPVALYMAIRYWNEPTSIIPRTKIRQILAIVFASLQIIGWAIGFYFIFR